MSQYKQDVQNFFDDINDLDYSAYEHLRMLQERSQLETIKNELDTSEKLLLTLSDLKLLQKADEVAKHISSVYDFSLSDTNNIPLDQWWWHLDKVAKGQLIVEYTSTTEKVI